MVRSGWAAQVEQERLGRAAQRTEIERRLPLRPFAFQPSGFGRPVPAPPVCGRPAPAVGRGHSPGQRPGGGVVPDADHQADALRRPGRRTGRGTRRGRHDHGPAGACRSRPGPGVDGHLGDVRSRDSRTFEAFPAGCRSWRSCGTPVGLFVGAGGDRRRECRRPVRPDLG